MTFSSYEFILFFLPASLIVFFTLSKHSTKSAIYFLILSSLVFYGMLSVRFIPLLAASVCANYFMCRKIESSSAKKSWLITGITLNMILLAGFKLIGILPPGISFWTFTQTACLVEVYRGSVRTGGFAEYSVFASFFPYMISGPVVNCREILPQLRSESLYRPDYDAIARGMTLFAIGMFKKVYFADKIAPAVNELFALPSGISFADAWIAALGYSVQLYFDFSGYSDMAIGVAMMFGLKLPENFDSPYQSLSIIDFWRRWHMSLGAWIRDYVYIPLGGSRRGELIRTRNVIIAMLFTGLWHGVGWNFVVWGIIHGLILAVNHAWRRLGVRLPAIVSWAFTFLCVVGCWVIFRAESLGDAVSILRAMMDFGNFSLSAYHAKRVAAMVIIVLFMPNSRKILERFRPGVVWLILTLGVMAVSFVNLSGISDFLYFQF